MSELTYNIKPLAGNRCKICDITHPTRSLLTIEEVKIPSEINGYKVIGINSSAGCPLRRKVIINKLFIPNTIESIGEDAFSHIEIKNVVFEENSQIKEIAGRAFAHTNMETLDINAKRVLRIGPLGFCESKINHLDLSKCTKIKEFGPNCFSSSHIKTVKLHPKIQTLGDGMFKKTDIEDISFLLGLSSCTFIPHSCFAHCHISQIPEDIFKKYTIGSFAFCYNNFVELNIPEYAKLGQNVFSHNTSLKYVVISAQNIPYCTFDGCSNLEKVTIKNVTEIHGAAFNHCAIKDLSFEDNKLQAIHDYAFAYNKLTKLSLAHTNLTYIGNRAFTCNPLKSIELPFYLEILFFSAFDFGKTFNIADIVNKSPFVSVL